jgi:hypothetical protein
MTKKYRNRYGDEYWFDEIGPNQYLFVMDGDSMKYCRFCGREMQEGVNMNDLGFFDPSGGPFIGIGEKLPFGTVNRIQSLEEGIVITVE